MPRKKIVTRIINSYNYSLTIPDRFYPFKSEIEGQWVRGIRSYNKAVENYQKKVNAATGIGLGLGTYRQIFHFIGSLIAITASTLISRDLFGSDIALYTLLAFVVLFISYQEFSLHPREYNQHWQKGIADWVVWFSPIGFYLFYFIR